MAAAAATGVLMTNHRKTRTIPVPLGIPRRVRARWAVHRVVDSAGAWMCGHKMTWAAHAMWKTLRMI